MVGFFSPSDARKEGGGMGSSFSRLVSSFVAAACVAAVDVAFAFADVADVADVAVVAVVAFAFAVVAVVAVVAAVAVLALLLLEEVRFVRTGFDTIRLESKGIMMINENENE